MNPPLLYYVVAGILTTILVITVNVQSEFLRVCNQDFYYGDSRVYLSGVNLGKNQTGCNGCDFGNGRYEAGSRNNLESYLTKIAAAGGNSLRMHIHFSGQFTPQFNSEGLVTATDDKGTLISDIGKFLDVAASKNIFVILILWNGAGPMTPKAHDLVWGDKKLTTYMDTVLKPMVQALKGKPALAAWEILNEPEGSITNEKNDNPCYDMSRLNSTTMSWTNKTAPMQRVTRFIARQAAAIHQVDKKALVTVGSWTYRPQTDAFSDTYNYYKDECLVPAAGGLKDARLDFFQVHAYSEKAWTKHSPFRVTAADYKLDRPLVIGEFSSHCGAGMTPEQLNDYTYNNGYKGAWSWQYKVNTFKTSETTETADRGMRRLADKKNNGLVRVRLNSRLGQTQCP